MRRASKAKPIALARSKGITLFVMVVTILVIAILYVVGERRLSELPAAAERANFQAVLEQIKTGVHFVVLAELAIGRGRDVRAMEGTNPMALLLETPSNYGGELPLVTDAVRKRGAWYFETATHELVYVVGGSSIEDVWVELAGVWVNLGQIRLRLSNIYEEEGAGLVPGQAGAPDESQWQGLVLQEVNQFTWQQREEQIELN